MQVERSLPVGTVSLLFSDIEGSTRLLHTLGERYAEALAEHRRLVRAAFREHGAVKLTHRVTPSSMHFLGPTTRSPVR
jgi:class 3 adenylate cyclase